MSGRAFVRATDGAGAAALVTSKSMNMMPIRSRRKSASIRHNIAQGCQAGTGVRRGVCSKRGSGAGGRVGGLSCRVMPGDGMSSAAGGGGVARNGPWATSRPRSVRRTPLARSSIRPSISKRRRCMEEIGGGDDGALATARRISCSWALSCSSRFLPFMTDQPNAAEKTPAQRGRVGRAAPNRSSALPRPVAERDGWTSLAGQRGLSPGVAPAPAGAARAAGCSRRARAAITPCTS